MHLHIEHTRADCLIRTRRATDGLNRPMSQSYAFLSDFREAHPTVPATLALLVGTFKP
jgi:hypothetical protein